MVHGNVQVSSIFINAAGEWKLGGFELLSSMKDESPLILASRYDYFSGFTDMDEQEIWDEYREKTMCDLIY